MTTTLGVINNNSQTVARFILRRNGAAKNSCAILSSSSSSSSSLTSADKQQRFHCVSSVTEIYDERCGLKKQQQQVSSQRRLYCSGKGFFPNRNNNSFVAGHDGAPSVLLSSSSSSSVSNNYSIWKTSTRDLSSAGDSKRDFYEVLGVQRGDDKGTIKKAYFNLAKKFHPDANKGDKGASEKFKTVTEAYECLSDDKQRELYDTYGHKGVDPNFSAGGGGGSGFDGMNFNDGSFHFSSSGPGGQMDPEDLFEAFFGGGQGRRQRGPRRGTDLQMHARLTFQEAVFGTSKDLQLRYQIRDSSTGQVEVKDREVTVETPAGMESGMNLRLQGQGAEGDPGAPRGNLIVTVIVEEDDYFQRDGADVHTEHPISVTQAILGGTIDVKTLSGLVEMKVPKGCQPDSKLIMRGKGIQHVSSSRKGNHIAHLKLKIPKRISAKQEELLREFDEEARESGFDFTGRIAKAAGSAFDTFFGNEKSKEDDKKTTKESPQNQDTTKTQKEKKRTKKNKKNEKKQQAQ
eukprot:CAMPEP_0197823918 /NCGR_PEP_ID=MMETSP1437-20131217/1235_1 /TAXON_ID=49252 ORGANISM="Eucampia antarctica, Strain CCMP1452" /NCGR_SAMPLE_ID=MMETSP1437 /ASSEMBLY_ACC=CAM_ASM_001096 /LENGTH=515 /DNA_ID=CAMNT_0043423325 /DNA_START=111 /DNA_END=1658 /DNA_ORIENTATION=+